MILSCKFVVSFHERRFRLSFRVDFLVSVDARVESSCLASSTVVLSSLDRDFRPAPAFVVVVVGSTIELARTINTEFVLCEFTYKCIKSLYSGCNGFALDSSS